MVQAHLIPVIPFCLTCVIYWQIATPLRAAESTNTAGFFQVTQLASAQRSAVGGNFTLLHEAGLGGGDERMTVLSIALALQFVLAALAGAAILSCAWVSKERQTPSAFWGKGLFHCVFVL